MNRRMLSKLLQKQVRVRPIARRIDSAGTELKPIDDVYVVIETSKETKATTLWNARTGRKVTLGEDHIREYMTDREGGTAGKLVLKVQIIFREDGVSVESFAPDRPNTEKSQSN